MEENLNARYWIRRRRELLGMTQADLAKKLGYKSKSSINKIENGSRKMPRKMLLRFADALLCTPSDLTEDIIGKFEVEMVGRVSCLPEEDKLSIIQFIEAVCDKKNDEMNNK